jgi:hypothetical protein
MRRELFEEPTKLDSYCKKIGEPALSNFKEKALRDAVFWPYWPRLGLFIKILNKISEFPPSRSTSYLLA